MELTPKEAVLPHVQLQGHLVGAFMKHDISFCTDIPFRSTHPGCPAAFRKPGESLRTHMCQYCMRTHCLYPDLGLSLLDVRINLYRCHINRVDSLNEHLADDSVPVGLSSFTHGMGVFQLSRDRAVGIVHLNRDLMLPRRKRKQGIDMRRQQMRMAADRLSVNTDHSRLGPFKHKEEPSSGKILRDIDNPRICHLAFIRIEPCQP